MPVDIRNFFQARGGNIPSKSTPKKEDTTVQKGWSKKRHVVEDSDDDTTAAPDKPSKATSRKKKADPVSVTGTETTASSYFASSKSQPKKPETTPKPTSDPPANGTVGVRTKSRSIAAASLKAAKSFEQNTIAHGDVGEDDLDALMDVDTDDGDDIYAADVKGRKRKSDDYAADESEGESLPKPKRVVTRHKPTVEVEIEDVQLVSSKSKATDSPAKAKKRKMSPSSGGEDDKEAIKSRKKTATSKPRAPRRRKDKAPDKEPGDVKSILDKVPIIDAPDSPVTTSKFDWKTRGAGGHANTGPPSNAGALDIPEGEENCLLGKTFVFTGLLKTLGRDEGQALVKRYGGKVTGAPSSKTDFVVLGDDAGPSKLKKIKEHGIKTIDEAGLFYLIKSLPANGGSGKGAESAKKKQADEEQKIRDQIAVMEAEEEKKKMAEAKVARKAASARGQEPPAPAKPLSQLWTAKYAPTQLNQICGNKACVEKIQNWLRNWSKARKFGWRKKGADGMGDLRAVILSGPPGIGKTTAAHLAAKLEGYDVIESNASDTRSKNLVENGISQVVTNTSLLGYFAGDGKRVDSVKKNIVLIMDEVDGMSSGDRGGVGALAKFCKKSEVPLILICNDRKLPKMKPFDFVALDIKFQRPTVDQIRARVMTICHREGLKLQPSVINSVIEGCNKDIRQIVNMLSTVKLDRTSMDFDESKKISKAWEKHVILKPWDIVQKLIGGGLFSSNSKATLNDKIELYFNDHEFSYLMVQENYLKARPAALGSHAYNGKELILKHLELLDRAAESISDGDLVDRMIHGPQQHWNLMPTHAVFSTVRPASFIAGQLIGSSFTSWLGNNSRYGKFSRAVREMHSHMRLRSSGDHNEVRQEYMPALWTMLIKRLEVEGKDAVEDIISLMDSYFLTREDFDSIQELAVGDQDMELLKIDSKAKAAFTRTYNLMSHPLPFMKASNVLAPRKASKEVPDLEEAVDGDDDADAVEAPDVADDDDAMDIKKDKYIKKPKAKPAKKGSKKGANSEEDGEKTTVGRNKGKAAARGRPKKK